MSRAPSPSLPEVRNFEPARESPRVIARHHKDAADAAPEGRGAGKSNTACPDN
ncbi:MAG TPA: hypothetical protein VIK97_19475 [Casimicrobiaceae bacterium]